MASFYSPKKGAVMRSIAGTLTAKELVENYGAIPDDKNPDIVGLVIGGRVIRANVRDLRIVEETIGSALIKADARRRLPRQAPKPIEPIKTASRPLGEAPPMDFIRDEEIVPIEEVVPPKVDFDMGKATSKRIIDDTLDEFESPSWLDRAEGLASDHKVASEEWTNGL